MNDIHLSHELVIYVFSLPIDFNVDDGGGLSVGAIIGIVASSCLVIVLILIVLRLKGYLGGKDLEDKGNIKCIILL